MMLMRQRTRGRCRNGLKSVVVADGARVEMRDDECAEHGQDSDVKDDAAQPMQPGAKRSDAMVAPRVGFTKGRR